MVRRIFLANAKAKANASQGLPEMIEIATEKICIAGIRRRW